MKKGKFYSEEERLLLEDIILNRRDVRGTRFLNQEIEEEKIDRILCSGLNAPSVGFSQPWEFVVIKDPTIKAKVHQLFEIENKKALPQFDELKQIEYRKLKLEGILEAPVNIAVFYKAADKTVLGQTSMKESGLYSVVCAIQNMWLMARAYNLGMGWVSILDPVGVKQIINAPDSLQLVAYLCLGYVEEFLSVPELETLQWEKRKKKDEVVFYDKYPDPSK